MISIDGAHILDRGIGTIRTPFGLTSIESLSTGVKTFLNILYIAKYKLPFTVDLTQCGYNVLDIIFSYLDDNPIIDVLLTHLDIMKCKHFEFLVNGKTHYRNNLDFVAGESERLMFS
jgi:hypothetical protein